MTAAADEREQFVVVLRKLREVNPDAHRAFVRLVRALGKLNASKRGAA